MTDLRSGGRSSVVETGAKADAGSTADSEVDVNADTQAGSEPHRLYVFHDGGCPVCEWEVRAYGKLDKADHIRWIDIVGLTDDQLPEDKNRQQLLNRFHVLDRQGQWHIGVDAFAAIWTELPGFRHGAWLFRTPGIRQLAEVGYRGFLKWQRWHRQRRLSQADRSVR